MCLSSPNVFSGDAWFLGVGFGFLGPGDYLPRGCLGTSGEKKASIPLPCVAQGLILVKNVESEIFPKIFRQLALRSQELQVTSSGLMSVGFFEF